MTPFSYALCIDTVLTAYAMFLAMFAGVERLVLDKFFVALAMAFTMEN